MLRMDSNISNDGRFEQHIIDATAQARQAALESKKYAGIAVKAAEAASGGSLSGVARVDACNAFTKTNTFGACTVFNGSARFAGHAHFCGDVRLSDRGYCVGTGLYNYDGDLYWGGTKLNGGGGSCGDVRACGDNVFTGTNTFAKVLFTCTVDFKGGASFNGDISLSCEKDVKSCNVLYNYNSDLYWGPTKLNGGGDVRAAGHNVFTGSNVFSSTTHFNNDATFIGAAFNDRGGQAGCCLLYNHNGDLYWGNTKLNGGGGGGGGDVHSDGDNTFTRSNVFDGGGNLETHGHMRITDGGTDLYAGDARLQNHNGDLYWGTTKLNGGGGGGDVYSNTSNVFTKCNTFRNNVNIGYDNGDHILFLETGIQVVSCTGAIVGHASYEAFGNFLNTLHS